MTLVLACASPRRRELLHLLTTEFECVPSDIDETPMLGELPEDYVVRMAVEKHKHRLLQVGSFWLQIQRSPSMALFLESLQINMKRR